MSKEFVLQVEDKLRQIEGELESVGRMVCSVKNGGATWNAINRAVGEVQRGIHNAYLMEEDND